LQVHVPLVQSSPVVQRLLHPPQLLVSLLDITQLVPQQMTPAPGVHAGPPPQLQALDAHVSFGEHAVVQLPQWLGSLLKCAQPVEQHTSPPVHT
jgi:hypothetical protein